MSGNIRPQLFRPVEPQWTHPGVKSGTSVCELISSSKQKKKKKKKKVQAGSKWLNILPKSSQGRKKPPPPDVHLVEFMCPVFTCMPGGVNVGDLGLCFCVLLFVEHC